MPEEGEDRVPPTHTQVVEITRTHGRPAPGRLAETGPGTAASSITGMSLSLPMAIQTLCWDPSSGGVIGGGPGAGLGEAAGRRPPVRAGDFGDLRVGRGDTVFSLLGHAALSAVEVAPAVPGEGIVAEWDGLEPVRVFRRVARDSAP